MAGGDTSSVVVTNGLRRLKLRKECDDLRLDVVAGLCSEVYALQMRALARGSDGLAEITEEDLAEVVLPKITDTKARAAMKPKVDQMVAGRAAVRTVVQNMIKAGDLPIPFVEMRHSHVVLV
jgi:type I restriction enzyme M protein